MDNDLSQVVDRTALIENLLNQVILKYSSPRKEAFEFFWNILLDSSIMPLGSKIKAVMAISQQFGVKLKQDSLHKVVSLRNAFAHHALDSHTTFVVGQTPDKSKEYYMLQTISHSGKTSQIRRDLALGEFNNHFKIAKETLIQLRDTVKIESE